MFSKLMGIYTRVSHINGQVGKKINTGTKGYIKLGTIKNKTLANVLNPSDFWINTWSRPEGK